MGAEATYRVTLGRKKDAGKALLETDALIFRGSELRLSIPYTRVSSVAVKDGRLQWAEKIRNPPTRADKLGVKSGQRVLLVGMDDGLVDVKVARYSDTHTAEKYVVPVRLR